jgi:methylated-DNA-[protein]-cysteine S-methyltransferase
MRFEPRSVVAAFVTCPAPWGVVHVATTAAGIVALHLDAETADFVDGLSRRLRGQVLPAEDGEVPPEWRAILDEAARQIGEYFAARRRRFELPIDLRVSDWDRLVLMGAARTGYGETVSYGELARRIGHPGANQAVGGAMSRNPIGLVIPCHRVVAATGLGGYGGSNYADRQAALAVKRRLLELEGALAADTKGAETTPEGTPGAMPGDTAGA